MKGWLRTGAVVLGCYALGVAVVWFLFTFWLHAPAAHVASALVYLGISGFVSLLAGVLVLPAVGRWIPRLGLKVAATTLFGTVAAIVNVLVTPLFMFLRGEDFEILVISLLFFLAVSLGLASLVGALMSRQIRDLHAGALRLAAGDLGTVVPVRGVDEVADLSRAFNRMSAELQAAATRQAEMERDRRELIASVSHDLRTPLASIRAMVEAINDGVVNDPATVTRYLASMQRETHRLASLIDDLFELSRIESGNLDLQLAPVPLPELVQEAVDGLQFQAHDKGILLQADIGAPVPPLPLDALRLQRALVNLIDNALRHTPRGGQVSVEVRVHNDGVEIAVSDTGDGVAPEDRAQVFDRFYRGEKSRSRDTGGAGLGLAIARGIVEAHRGTLELENALPHGARFVMRLQA